MQRVIERILNLLAFLLTVGRPVSADEIRYTVAGYDQDTDEAFRRTFERDKDLLRRLGVPLRLDFTDRWEVEQGYVVTPEEYALPDPGLSDEERAALLMASRVARLGGETTAQTALLKLGGAPFAADGDPLGADLGADPERLGDLFGAIVESRTVKFRYSGSSRTVKPLGLAHRMGHWYLVGIAGKERRTFRVDRIEGLSVGGRAGAFQRPPGFRVRDAVPGAPWEAGADRVTATVRFDADVAWWARRQLAGRADLADEPDGSLTARIPVASPEAFIGWLLGFEARAVLVDPPELRQRLVAHVRGDA